MKSLIPVNAAVAAAVVVFCSSSLPLAASRNHGSGRRRMSVGAKTGLLATTTMSMPKAEKVASMPTEKAMSMPKAEKVATATHHTADAKAEKTMGTTTSKSGKTHAAKATKMFKEPAPKAEKPAWTDAKADKPEGAYKVVKMSMPKAEKMSMPKQEKMSMPKSEGMSMAKAEKMSMPKAMR